MTRACLNCGRTGVEFPLGRPRKNGVRFPMAYCCECLSSHQPLKAGGVEARKRANRESMSRLRKGVQIAVVGPATCHGCGIDLWWDAKVWRDVDGRRHVCAVARAA